MAPSDVKDTDLIVKLADVHPDGRAFNLDEGVLRVRWREGYERPVFMERGQVYRIELPPLITSDAFGVGHRVRIAISSSSFPQFERNLNTGGNNADEAVPVTARNRVHHGPAHPSVIVLPVIDSPIAERHWDAASCGLSADDSRMILAMGSAGLGDRPASRT